MMFLQKLKRSRGFLAGVALSGIVFLFVRAKDNDQKDDNSYFDVSKNLDIYSTLFRQLNDYYVDPIQPGKLVKTSIDAMLEDLDPYTNYITESDIEEFEFMTTGKYGGIGANMHRKGDEIFIGDVYENSPAQKAGLHPGDQVEDIDNQPVKGKSVDDISLLLKGSPGTHINVRVKDIYSGKLVQKMITRSEIEISSVPFAGLIGPNNDIAYVKLTQFTQGCGRQVREGFDSLKKVQPNIKGLVLDLRNNPGGLLEEAVSVCNIFVDKGTTVVHTRGKLPESDKEYKTSGAAWNTDLPLTVLVNHSSASASEIVAGTMQDLDRGVIIGERSYGKGLVQVTKPLGYNARLKLTVARYYTPSGRCIQMLDYTHRNADGSVGFIPDSLKKPFTTAHGRTVLSGGGIEPDVKLKDEPVSLLAATLYSKNYFFDYATEYTRDHKAIAPATQFQIADADYSKFLKWLDGKDFSYETETEEGLDSVESIARREGYYEGAKDDFKSLEQKLAHDKKLDLSKHKDEIRHDLEGEIVSRYYFMRGRIAQGLQYDKDLDQALTLLANKNNYQALLTPRK
jgi:carboxyl-terminal processing protease